MKLEILNDEALQDAAEWFFERSDERSILRIRQVAQAQLKSDLKQFISWIKKHKDDEMGYAWGQRQGAPTIVITLDPLEWQSLQSQLEEV